MHAPAFAPDPTGVGATDGQEIVAYELLVAEDVEGVDAIGAPHRQ